MHRRSFLVLTLAGVLEARLGEAQQEGKIWRIGVLSGTPPNTPEAARPWEAFWQALREFGYIEGQNLAVERRWATGGAAQYHEMASELVNLRPDVIVAAFTPSVSAAKRATSTIPIVMAMAGDPVGTGLVVSLARPGGNITGVTGQNSPEVAGKRLELLKEAFPNVARVGLLVNRTLPHRDSIWRDLQRTAESVAVKLQPVEVGGPKDFTDGFSGTASGGMQAMIVHPDPLAFGHRHEIAAFGLKNKVPIMAAYGFAEAGCLMSYDSYWPDMYRRTATYVDRILKGAKPADLPIEQPTKFALTINVNTAKALGVTIPHSLLLRANHIVK